MQNVCTMSETLTGSTSVLAATTDQVTVTIAVATNVNTVFLISLFTALPQVLLLLLLSARILSIRSSVSMSVLTLRMKLRIVVLNTSIMVWR